jgi:stage II sporulation protein D
MTKNRNVYLSGGTYTESQSSAVVGAFHTAHGTYATRDGAEAAVSALRAQGTLAFVAFDSGAWKVRSSSFAGSGSGRETGSNRAVSVVRTGTTDIIFQFDYGTDFHLAVRPMAQAGVKAQTWHRQRRYYGIFEFNRFDGNNMNVINIVDMQDYLKGVVPNEMSPSWPIESLKAQAVSARSFAAGSLSRHRNDGFNICTTTHCQVYFGTSSASANSDRAVDETFGMYMIYGGTPCTTVAYHASCGGATEDSENVWSAAVPYLRGVVDPYENAAQIPGYVWNVNVTNAQISAYLTQIGVTNSGVSDFYVDRMTRMGNVRSVTVTGTDGRVLLTRTGDNARIFTAGLLRYANPNANLGGFSFSLRFVIGSGDAVLTSLSSGGRTVTHTNIASLYAIDGSGNVRLLPQAATVMLTGGGSGLYPLPTLPGSGKGVYTVSGRGNGHNVGMSQWGARGMADRGFKYDQILKHYYTGVEVVVSG